MTDGKDRFGDQIFPKKPRDDVPGPGNYENLNIDVIKSRTNRAFIINPPT